MEWMAGAPQTAFAMESPAANEAVERSCKNCVSMDFIDGNKENFSLVLKIPNSSVGSRREVGLKPQKHAAAQLPQSCRR